MDILHYSLIHLQLLRGSDAELALVASKMPLRFAAVTNKEISQLNKQAVPEIHDTKVGAVKLRGDWGGSNAR